jgi:hypothetical protein
VRLPAGLPAVFRPINLHPYQRAIADALAIRRSSARAVLKSASARVNVTTHFGGRDSRSTLLAAIADFGFNAKRWAGASAQASVKSNAAPDHTSE